MELLARRGFDADHASFRDSLRRFVADEVVPHLEEWRADRGVSAALFAALGEQGFLGTAVPEEFGGGGVDDPRFAVLLVEELAAAGAAGLAHIVAQHVGVAIPAVLGLAESPERSAWLEELACGQLIAVTAPGQAATARSVPGAGIAGLLVLLESGRAEVVPRDAVSVEPVQLLAGFEAGAADVAVLDRARCFPVATGGLQARQDAWLAIAAVASARAALDLTAAYVLERKVFGRPIAAFENTRFRLAELGAELAAVGALVDTVLDGLAEGGLDPAVAAAARLVGEKVRDQLVDQGIQLHGGYGYMREYPIANGFGDARFARIAGAQASDPRPLLADALGL